MDARVTILECDLERAEHDRDNAERRQRELEGKLYSAEAARDAVMRDLAKLAVETQPECPGSPPIDEHYYCEKVWDLETADRLFPEGAL